MAIEKRCRIEGCSGSYKSGGWCHGHYERFRKYGDPLAGRQAYQPLGEACSVDGCRRKPVAKCLCSTHYSLFRKYGDPNAAKFKWHQNGRAEWHETSHGYVWRYAGRGDPNATANGFVYQHREVMAEKLGRPLRANESVHHINGNRADNRPENLELWVKSQPAGQRVQDLLAWAREITAEYAYFDDGSGARPGKDSR